MSVMVMLLPVPRTTYSHEGVENAGGRVVGRLRDYGAKAWGLRVDRAKVGTGKLKASFLILNLCI